MSTFISYSRVNSAFVVRLARDLKSAGFDVWLDQLDIPKGARWDDEIEAAVERASTFMIVLAPESMESQNVKDELSYALDSGKFILPVVIRPCKIPLRLRRFQYVDFTDKPYKDSLTDIKNLLSKIKQNTKPLPVPTEDVPHIAPDDAFVSINEAMAPHEQFDHPEHLISEKSEGQDPRRKVIPLAAIIATIGIAAIGVFAVSAARSRNVPSPVTSTLTLTSTSTPDTPTLTPTITPTPLPRQVTDFHGVTMMLISAGEFIMGTNDGGEDEGPAQKLFLSDFYIDKYEVTNASYKACVDSGQCRQPTKNASRTHSGYFGKPEYNKYPVVYVTWEMANDYCSWRGARLSTEAEWEKAARGPEGNTYPWGNDVSCDQANFSGCTKDTEPVNSYENGQSAYDVMGLAGNVSEWVNSLYMDYPYDSAREDPLAAGERVVRGGSFVDSEEQVSAISRQKADPEISKDNVGFRCVGMPHGSLDESTLVTITPTINPATKAGTSGNAKEKDRLTATLSLVTETVTLPQLKVISTVVTPTIETPTLQAITKTVVSPTTKPPTEEPSTVEPSTAEPPTEEPPTVEPPTAEPPTEEPPTVEPPTAEPPTEEPPTSEPPTEEPPTAEPPNVNSAITP
jgi:formylglycine-generating enzyme